jgi:hypothetical protein
MVRDKESNIEKATNAYQEALKIYTVDRYPIIYQQVKSNLKTLANLDIVTRSGEDLNIL